MRALLGFAREALARGMRARVADRHGHRVGQANEQLLFEAAEPVPAFAHHLQNTQRHPGPPQACPQVSAQPCSLAKLAVELPARLGGRVGQIHDLLSTGAAGGALARQAAFERVGVDEAFRRGAAHLTALLQQPNPRVGRPQQGGAVAHRELEHLTFVHVDLQRLSDLAQRPFVLTLEVRRGVQPGRLEGWGDLRR